MNLTLVIYQNETRLAIIPIETEKELPADLPGWLEAHIAAQNPNFKTNPPRPPLQPNCRYRQTPKLLKDLTAILDIYFNASPPPNPRTSTRQSLSTEKGSDK
ncbi:hypothetical protein ES703_101225 [subsurface metagenome]